VLLLGQAGRTTSDVGAEAVPRAVTWLVVLVKNIRPGSFSGAWRARKNVAEVHRPPIWTLLQPIAFSVLVKGVRK